jgi:hypothetical protein
MTDEQKSNIYGICVYKDYILEGPDSTDRTSNGGTSTPPITIPVVPTSPRLQSSTSNGGGSSINSPTQTSSTSPTGGALPFSMPPSRSLITTTRCFCFVSRFPFFQLHFDVLYTVLGKSLPPYIASLLHSPPLPSPSCLYPFFVEMEEAVQVANNLVDQTGRASSSSHREDEGVTSHQIGSTPEDRSSAGLTPTIVNSPLNDNKISSYNTLEDDDETGDRLSAGGAGGGTRQEPPPPLSQSHSALGDSALMRIRRLYESSTGKTSFSLPATPPPPPPAVYDCVLIPKGWDETATQIVSILERYRMHPAPLPGECLKFHVSTEKSLSFSRVSMEEGEEELLFAECCVPIALHSLPRKLFLALFSAVLLEKKIVFISPDVRVLSSLV